jgi:ABC-type glycerol-3-phosphate transport system substrate-binding protein
MKRLFSFVVAAAAVLAFCAGAATADQALKLGPGPPALSGDFDGKGALVVHCDVFVLGEDPGAVVFTPKGGVRGAC